MPPRPGLPNTSRGQGSGWSTPGRQQGVGPTEAWVGCRGLLVRTVTET